MTLYLHIGPSKTASTLAQILFASGDGLAQEGAAGSHCLYLPVGRTVGGGAGRVHHPMARALQAPETPEARALLAATETCLARAGAAGQSVLISSEMLRPEPGPYLPLQEMARRHGHDMRMVFVCRDPVARLNSMYTQNIKTGRFDSTLADFVTTALPSDALRPCTVLRPGFAAIGAGFDLLPYEAAGMEPLYRQFCARIGLAVAPKPPAEGMSSAEGRSSAQARVNAGPSAAAVRLLREGGVAADTPNLYQILQKADRDLAQPAYFGATPALAQKVRAALAAELEALAGSQMLLGTYQGEAILQPCDENSVDNYEDYRAHVLALLRRAAEKSPGPLRTGQ